MAKDSKKESAVWTSFKAMWPFYSERMEPGIGAGLPDVLLLDRNGKVGLVELKRPDEIELRPSQWAWHGRWQANCGKSCLVTHAHGLWTIYRIETDDVRALRIAQLGLDDMRARRVIASMLGLSL